MLNHLKIRTKILLAIFLTLILLSTGLILMLVGVNRLENSFNNYLDVNQPKLDALYTMYNYATLSGLSIRNKVLKPELTTPGKMLIESNKKFTDALAQVEKFTSTGNFSTQDKLKLIKQAWQESLATRTQVNNLVNEGKIAEGEQLLAKSEQPTFKIIRVALDELLQQEQTAIKLARQEVQDEVSSIYIKGLTLGGLSVLLVLIINLGIFSSIIQRINLINQLLTNLNSKEGDLTRRIKISGRDEISLMARGFNLFIDKVHTTIQHIAKTTGQVNLASQDLNQLSRNNLSEASSQAEATHQVADALNIMLSSLQEITISSQQAAEATSLTNNYVQKGQVEVNANEENINRLANQVYQAQQQTQALSQSSEQIDNIVNVINEIAEQTNLLALNAAIEAARAGEQGRGFAVVAGEVQSLAQRTQNSTLEIQGLITQLLDGIQQTTASIEASHSQTEICVASMRSTQEALSAVSQQIAVISQLNLDIAYTTQQQEATTNQVENNLATLTDFTLQVSKTSSTTQEASHHLADLADRLHQQISSFKL